MVVNCGGVFVFTYKSSYFIFDSLEGEEVILGIPWPTLRHHHFYNFGGYFLVYNLTNEGK